MKSIRKTTSVMEQHLSIFPLKSNIILSIKNLLISPTTDGWVGKESLFTMFESYYMQSYTYTKGIDFSFYCLHLKFFARLTTVSNTIQFVKLIINSGIFGWRVMNNTQTFRNINRYKWQKSHRVTPKKWSNCWNCIYNFSG